MKHVMKASSGILLPSLVATPIFSVCPSMKNQYGYMP